MFSLSPRCLLPSRSWQNTGPKQDRKWRLFPRLFFPCFVFLFFSPLHGMEIAARFVALALLDLLFYEYAGEFCKLAETMTVDKATLNHLFWLGSNSHHPVDLPDTTGLSWREGVFRCQGSVRARARTIALSSLRAAAHSSQPPSAALTSSKPFAATASPPPFTASSSLPPFAAHSRRPAGLCSLKPAGLRWLKPAGGRRWLPTTMNDAYIR